MSDIPSKQQLEAMLDDAGLAIDNEGNFYKTKNCRFNLGMKPAFALAQYMRRILEK